MIASTLTPAADEPASIADAPLHNTPHHAENAPNTPPLPAERAAAQAVTASALTPAAGEPASKADAPTTAESAPEVRARLAGAGRTVREAR
ncbi:hypothetical protein SAMN05216188_106211 [Lentzea xinjiangensis]|uniref:Uncharacterized protein n=1 Tax=Lentzea xinjiangensis TaxID=402600 RepID=A0A1H9JYF9_9PSEU|nr:hypothetical protein SAMN05216188_106211 [Lentzea xinjiangensis]